MKLLSIWKTTLKSLLDDDLSIRIKILCYREKIK